VVTPQPYEEVLVEMKKRDRADETRGIRPSDSMTAISVETGACPAEVVAELSGEFGVIDRHP
jgi:cytidylate kinase